MICFRNKELMALILKPPAPLVFDKRLPSIFLAGSIEMGKALRKRIPGPIQRTE
jgi:hypothetical protein